MSWVCDTQRHARVLTVGAAVYLHPHANLATRVPLQRHEADKAGPHRVQQLVVHHAVRVHVSREGLQGGTDLVRAEVERSTAETHSIL